MVSVSLLEIILHVVTHVNQMLTMYVMYCTVICTIQYSVVRTVERVWVVGIELGTHKSDPKERVRQFFLFGRKCSLESNRPLQYNI